MEYTVFYSELGWMAMATAGDAVAFLTFGHRTRVAAERAVRQQIRRMETAAVRRTGQSGIAGRIAARLRDYASGKPDDFFNVPIDVGPMSEFQEAILTQCRLIPHGRTLSYAELAAGAGFPRAARAAGNCMARNRIPLIVPCHRVICTDGRLGHYSSPGGVEMKRRLLAMESGKLA